MQYVNIFSARHVCIICLHFKFKVEAKPGNINIPNCFWDLCGLKRPLWASGDIFCMWNLSAADMLPYLGFLVRFCRCNQHYFVYTLMMVVTTSSNIVKSCESWWTRPVPTYQSFLSCFFSCRGNKYQKQGWNNLISMS